MEMKRSAVTQVQRWNWGKLASGAICALALFGWVSAQPAVAGGPTEAMKMTIDEVLMLQSSLCSLRVDLFLCLRAARASVKHHLQ